MFKTRQYFRISSQYERVLCLKFEPSESFGRATFRVPNEVVRIVAFENKRSLVYDRS